MCKRAFVLLRNRILHQQMTCYRTVTAIKNRPGMGGFPDTELTNFPNTGALGKVSSAAYYCSAEVCRIGFRSLPNARIPWATRKLCVLILFAEDVDPVTDPDKLVRRYHWSRLGGQGLCERCQRCIQVLPQFGMRGSPIFHDAIALFLRNSK